MRVLDQLFFDRRFPREKPSKQKKAPETSVLSLQRSRNRSERRVVVRGPFRELGRGSGPGRRLPICTLPLPLVPMLPGRAPRLLCHTRRRHWREGQSCNTATLPKRAGKEGTVVSDAGKCHAASNGPRTRAAPCGDRAQGSQPLGADT